MSIRDTELEFEVNDTYWLDELDADMAFESEFLDEDDWAIGDDEEYDEFDEYDDFVDWEIDLLDNEV